MIKIRDVIDEIVDYCFDDTLKEILEVDISGHKVTVKSQFLFHHRRACYRGTVDELKEAILYKIHQNYHLIVKIKDYQKNIEKIVDIDEYGNVRRQYNESLGTDGIVSSMGSKHVAVSKEVGNTSNSDEFSNVNVTNVQTGTSETNELWPADQVLKQPVTKDINNNKKKYKLVNGEIVEEETALPLKSNSVEMPIDNVQYQHFTNQINSDAGLNTTVTDTSQSVESKNQDDRISSYSRTKGVKKDEAKWQVEYITNEARLKAWRLEIPKLKQKFWGSFHWLFVYENFQ